MKPKHQGLTATLILVLSLVIAIGYTGYSFQDGTKPIKNVAPVMPVNINVPDPQEIHLMRRLSSKLKALSFPTDSLLERASLEIFGDKRSVDEILTDADVKNGYSKNLEYDLTFTFSSGRRRFCIIDDVFYAQGETLPDGGKILQVEAHKVLIQKESKQVWIPLAISDAMIESQTSSPKKEQ